MRVASSLLKHALYPGLSRLRYFRRSVEPSVTVLTYHGILPTGYTSRDSHLDGNLVTKTSFRNQLQLLRKEYNVISPQEFLSWCEGTNELPPRTVLLTCDDGLRNHLTNMLPVLEEFRLSCLFFVTGASLSDVPARLWYEELYLALQKAPHGIKLTLAHAGINPTVEGVKGKRELWWKLVRSLSRYDAGQRGAILDEIRDSLGVSEDWSIEYRKNPALARRFMNLTLAELRQLVAAGMTIGAHTLSHPVLSQVSSEMVMQEICECRERLEQALGQPIWALAYPFGDPSSVTDREFRVAREAGFTCAFVNTGGSVTAESDRFALPRVHITASMTLSELQARISGLHGSLQRRFSSPQPAFAARVSAL